MAMRVCIYCKQDVTYERENRNLLKGGAVGFWTNPLTKQATCPNAPVDTNGQQLHSVGDVHTPPVDDPAKLEEFLNGTYVPPAPVKLCDSVYGMSEDGAFLSCGLEDGHYGMCEAGTPVDTSADEAQNSADAPGPRTIEMRMEQDEQVCKVIAEGDGISMRLEFDTETVGPAEVNALLDMFPREAAKAIAAALMGIDPALMDAAQEALEAAQKPEPPKILEDPADIEKFLRGEE